MKVLSEGRANAPEQKEKPETFPSGTSSPETHRVDPLGGMRSNPPSARKEGKGQRKKRLRSSEGKDLKRISYRETSTTAEEVLR